MDGTWSRSAFGNRPVTRYVFERNLAAYKGEAASQFEQQIAQVLQ
jgi:hypothetical protein